MSPRPQAALAAVLLLAACGAACRGPAAGRGPSVDVPAGAPIVLISIDTLRADRLPAYGYQGVETPAIDALRADGVLFENAWSHIPLTLPSHASILTGLLPPDHGLRDNIGYRLDRQRVAAGEIPSLPHALRERGYATGAAVSSFVLRRKMGLDEGFDFYEDSIEFRTGTGLGGLQRPGRETLDLARDWLRSVAERPFFFFFHLYEPHTPYQPPAPFAGRYPNPYDGEVATADHVVGELLAELRRLGVYERAIVILLSDHGEGLGEHGEDEHGVLLYRTTLQVPLILKLPAAQLAGASAGRPVQLIDVYPTLAELVGLPGRPELRGSSLLTALDDGAPARRIYAETYYPRLHFGWSELASLVDDRYHYVEGPDPELFDLAADPGELHNVLADERRVYAALRDELAGYERDLTAPAEVDPETREALAALGYLGSAAAVEGPLPDPKSRLPALADLQAGFRYRSAGEHRRAVESFRAVLADNPAMLDAWEFLARSLESLGEREEAVAAYRKAIEISGGASHLAMSAASLYFSLHRLDEAESHARLALDSNPSFAHGLLAQIAVERGDLDEAEHHARLAFDEDSPRLGPLRTLAAVQHARGRYEQALATVGEVETAYAARRTADPELVRGLYLLKGKILADLARVDAAEQAFEREIELFPDAVYAYSNLALLYGLSGRPQRVGGVLQRMVEANPSPEAYAEAVKSLRILGFEPGARSLLRHARSLYPESDLLRELG